MKDKNGKIILFKVFLNGNNFLKLKILFYEVIHLEVIYQAYLLQNILNEL